MPNMIRGRKKMTHWLAARETGHSVRGHPAWRGGDDLRPKLYRNFHYVGKYDGDGYGAVFNVDFSPDGSMCVAAMEQCAIQVLDPHNHSLISLRARAHSDCVNCVRFLDSRMFVTCSDDTNVCVWDVRNLSQQVHVLTGHSNWVKNIEYAQHSRQLLTSGFDGSVYLWDLNRCESDTEHRQCVFHTDGLMRSKLAPDCSQLIISSRYGYIMLVHELNLDTLKEDLEGFKPTSHRDWRDGRAWSNSDMSYEHVFTRRRNRVELIDDFPQGFRAEMIASLEVHPRGACVVSRLVNRDTSREVRKRGGEEMGVGGGGEMIASREVHPRGACVVSRLVNRDTSREMTCVHDIQAVVEGWQVQPHIKGRKNVDSFLHSSDSSDHSYGESGSGDDDSHSSDESLLTFEPTLVHADFNTNTDSDDEDYDGEENLGNSFYHNAHLTVLNSAETLSALPDTKPQPSLTVQTVHVPHFNDRDLFDTSSGVLSRSHNWGMTSQSPSSSSSPTNTTTNPTTSTSKEIHKASDFDYRRLLFYGEEPNVGRGYIKEQSFSADGRIIASPFGPGIRLFAFSENCDDLMDCQPDPYTAPMELTDLVSRKYSGKDGRGGGGSGESELYHSNYILTAKFAPQGYLLATGCLDGKVKFMQPFF